MANKPTPIDPERITTEAQKAAWLYDTVIQACPYPLGTEASNVFIRAFEAAKQAIPFAVCGSPVDATKPTGLFYTSA
jgi:hypothetical protein